jgi:hypothetical protein
MPTKTEITAALELNNSLLLVIYDRETNKLHKQVIADRMSANTALIDKAKS